MSEEQLRETLERTDTDEREWFDRVGRRLNSMLEAVRDAKNMAKPVQTAIAEAINAYRQAAGACKQRQNVADKLKEIPDGGPPGVVKNTVDTVVVPSDEGTTKSLLEDIVQEMKALRHDVNDIRSAQRLDGGEAVNGETWVEVVKKGKASKTKGSATAPPLTEAPGHTVKQRPPAILINTSTSDFPELLKKIRGGVNREVIDEHVVGMRQTKSGSLLMELRGDQQQIEAVHAEVSKTAGANVEVKSLQQKTMVEIRDLDQWTDGEEVACALVADTGVNRDELKVVSVSKRFGGTQAALVTVPTAACQKLLAHGRIRVGLVNCRVRQGQMRVRCFRCLSFGHMSKECVGPDRSACCRRCGTSGHRAAGCEATSQQAKAFEAMLGAIETSPVGVLEATAGGSVSDVPSK